MITPNTNPNTKPNPMNNSPLNKLLKNNHRSFTMASNDDLNELLDVMNEESLNHGGSALMNDIRKNLGNYFGDRLNNYPVRIKCQTSGEPITNNPPLDKLLKNNHDAFANASDDDLIKFIRIVIAGEYKGCSNPLMDSIKKNINDYLSEKDDGVFVVTRVRPPSDTPNEQMTNRERLAEGISNLIKDSTNEGLRVFLGFLAFTHCPSGGECIYDGIKKLLSRYFNTFDERNKFKDDTVEALSGMPDGAIMIFDLLRKSVVTDNLSDNELPPDFITKYQSGWQCVRDAIEQEAVRRGV